MNKKQLIKYLNNELDAIERRKTIEWIRKHPDNHKKFNMVKAEHVVSTFKNIPNNPVNNSVFFERFKNSIKKRKPKKLLLYGCASAIVIIALLWNSSVLVNNSETIIQNPQKATIAKSDGSVRFTTKRGDRKEVYLPDGSKIILNADSQLIYPKEFNDSLREVTLVGEAFFDIKRNIYKPFIVNSNNLKIRVLGTSFNVKSYSKDKKIETTLVTGKVELIKDEETPIILAPSQKAVFYKKENKMEIEEVKSHDVVAWKDGSLIFNKTPLHEVAIDLERKYNVKININSQKLLNYEYTGTFDNLSIYEVLKVLTISSPIKYSVKNKEIKLWDDIK
ncbi:FecR family protein [Aestuariivivens insulae]|uniref:FecR family protein n=1 Tax=Aestuariivivens insulae TaxID=1621988 RepID=UPI001F5AF814|nr:FecR family protein [Aestuariivivens insulae]